MAPLRRISWHPHFISDVPLPTIYVCVSSLGAPSPSQFNLSHSWPHDGSRFRQNSRLGSAGSQVTQLTTSGTVLMSIGQTTVTDRSNVGRLENSPLRFGRLPPPPGISEWKRCPKQDGLRHVPHRNALRSEWCSHATHNTMSRLRLISSGRLWGVAAPASIESSTPGPFRCVPIDSIEFPKLTTKARPCEVTSRYRKRDRKIVQPSCKRVHFWFKTTSFWSHWKWYCTFINSILLLSVVFSNMVCTQICGLHNPIDLKFLSFKIKLTDKMIQ